VFSVRYGASREPAHDWLRRPSVQERLADCDNASHRYAKDLQEGLQERNIGKAISALVSDIIIPIAETFVGSGDRRKATLQLLIGNGMKFALGIYAKKIGL